MKTTHREIGQRWPETHTVMVTAAKDPRLVRSALDAGCCRFVPKDADVRYFLQAMGAAAVGLSYLSTEVRE